jgi:hypothetical protein
MVTARGVYEMREKSREERRRNEPPRNGDGSDKATPTRDRREIRGAGGEGNDVRWRLVDAAINLFERQGEGAGFGGIRGRVVRF